MKILIKLLHFAKPLDKFAVPYFLFTVLVVIFGTLNITLLGPLMKVLFTHTQEVPKAVSHPEFAFKLDYFTALFNYYTIKYYHTYGIMGSLFFVCVSLVVCAFLSNFGKYFQSYYIEKFNQNILRKLRERVFNHILVIDYQTYINISKPEIMTRINNDIGNVQNSMSTFLLAIFRDLFQLLVYLFVLFYISYKLTFASLVLLPFSAILISRVVKSLRKKIHQIMESHSSLYSVIDEVLEGFKIIKVFGAEKVFRHTFSKENEKMLNLNLKKSRRDCLISPFSEFFGILSVVIIVMYGGFLVIEKKEINPEDFMVFVAVFSQILRPAKAMSNGMSGIFSATVSGQRIFDFLAIQPTIKDKPEAKEIKEFQDKIVFENVSFGYSEDNLVLENISFEIKKGETIGLVGMSGGGKTSLLNLIPRFYDVKGGKILIDGEDIRDVKLESYRRLMGMVSQEALLFEGSFHNNIAFGDRHISREEVIRNAKIANAHDFISATPKGYETELGNRGMNLSGGQKQRLAIARALTRNPEILLLDEATSALDGESENKIQEALKNLSGQHTCIVIAHRLSTIKSANKILVVDHGRIVEMGSHETLYDLGGIYRTLYDLHQLSHN